MTLFTGNVPGAQQNSKAERKVDDEGGKLSFLRGKRQSLSLGLAKENEIFSSSGVIIIFKKKIRLKNRTRNLTLCFSINFVFG